MTSENFLEIEFRRIGQHHHNADLHWVARDVLGASVIRVFRRGTKKPLLKFLTSIKIENLKSIRKQKTFRRWFQKELTQLARKIKHHNRNNLRINPGYKWGHAAKILNLYLRHIVLHSRYFSDKDVERLSPWLYVPIDGIIIKQLRDFNVSLPFRRIREVDSARKFFYVQDTLSAAAASAGVPPIWFDDKWGMGRPQ